MYGKPTLPESKMFYNADGRVVHTNMKYCSICGSLADLVGGTYYQCQANSTHIAPVLGAFIVYPE